MTLQDYIKLAEATQKLMPLEPAIHYHVEFHNASMEIGPAMAKALIEAEKLIMAASTMLSKPRMTGRENEEMDMAKSMLDKALSNIQALQENKNEQR